MCGHFFDHGVGSVIAKALPVAAAFIPGVGPLASAALSAGAGALGSKLQGGSWGDALKMGALSGVGSLAAPAIGSAFQSALPETSNSISGVLNNLGLRNPFSSGAPSGAALAGSAPDTAALAGGSSAAANEAISLALAAADPSLTDGVSLSPGTEKFLSGLGNSPSATASAASPQGIMGKLVDKATSNPLSALNAIASIMQNVNQTTGPQSQQAILQKMQQQQDQQAAQSAQAINKFNNATLQRTPALNPLPVADYYTYGSRPEVSFYNSNGKKPLTFATGGQVPGGALSGGQDDDIDAKLSHGEFVIPADVVSALGDGTNDAGAAKLHKMMDSVRKHKTGSRKYPPKAKSVKSYMGGKNGHK